MSVLNQSGEEQVECPLCMEPLEVDDLNFFPCTCGYQICRFCWHRIRTDENGLCPACRKAYSENPADFTPLSKEQVAQLKAEKRQRDQQKKAKLSESRKHLASVRVVQRNLVFVVGLPLRLADAEILKRHEYFGKFGKIHKVVINQSTSYAGSQGPSASAYVTYMKSEDALRAIQSVNNITLDGRLIKSSLGTTKYCSHFMKNQPCPKPDCMYLHDFGDPEASFTKEQMHAGKHQEYEKKLHEALLSKTQQSQQNGNGTTGNGTTEKDSTGKTNGNGKKENANGNNSSSATNNTNKDNWPQLNPDCKSEAKKSTADGKGDSCSKDTGKSKSKTKVKAECNKKTTEKVATTVCRTGGGSKSETKIECREKLRNEPVIIKKEDTKVSDQTDGVAKLPVLDDNSSFFSQNTFQKVAPEQTSSEEEHVTEQTIFTDTFPEISSSEDWAAAFGLNKTNVDDLEHKTMNGFGYEHSFNSTLDYQQQNGYISKIHENLLDCIASKSSQRQDYGQYGHNKDFLNGFDQQISKFFTDFCKNGHNGMNGLNGLQQQHNGYVHNGIGDRHNLLLFQQQQQQQQQRQLEEQLMNLNFKQQSYIANGLHGNHLSSDILGQNLTPNFGGHVNNQLFAGSGAQKSLRQHAEDELDFDPFQETQKGFAELIENEQNHKVHNTARSSVSSSQINGLVHNQITNSHLPPPPPGFIQNNTHMNSFGSKILPYLNMGSSSQQQTQPLNNSTTNNWPGTYSSQMQQHKGTSSCNDWKVLDPAIVTSSRHLPLANMAPLRDHHYGPSVPQLANTQNGPLRPYEYTSNSSYSSYTPTNFSFTAHLNQQQQQLNNWLGTELNAPVSSPPGFRSSSQAKQQQEC